MLDWTNLRNPLLGYDDWSIKDASMLYEAGVFYLFFSAFYHDDGLLRSHVVEVTTTDFRTFSPPIFNWSGQDAGWIGVCSPNISKIGDTYILTYNSWGDKPGRPNQLLYATSSDLRHWDAGHALASDLTTGKRVIDAALVETAGDCYLIFKDPYHQPQVARARADDLTSWLLIGQAICRPRGDQPPSHGHENYQFLHIDGRWRLICTNWPPHLTWLYTMRDDGSAPEHWLDWHDGYPLAIPPEAFNTADAHNAGFLADWRGHDGYFYLLYAGNTELKSFAGRGQNRLGLARSRDLLRWTVPGDNHAELE